MSASLFDPVHARFRPLTAIGARYSLLFCIAILAGASLLASLALACATPFAAYAVVASAMLPLPTALVAVTAAWAVNQAIGFGVLGYPHDIVTLIWGLAIGIAALIATAAADLTMRSLNRGGSRARLAVALIAAYVAYEVVLFACTFLLGGAGAFAAAVVMRLALLNAMWLMGLVAIAVIFRLARDYGRPFAVRQ